MKKKDQKKGLLKGTPTAVLLSATIHMVLLLLAGGFVVFSVVKKQEKKFVPPPPVERPKMNLIKPRVKMKKTVKPGSVRRIVSKSPQAMPDIELPDSVGVAEGLSGGLGGFELMPDPSEMTLLGAKSSTSVGNDLEGTFYSLSLNRKGREISAVYQDALIQFFESGWNPRSLAPYYRWPQKLYATFIYIPTIPFEYIPRSFGVPDEMNTEQWLVHYRGKIQSETGGRFRFWGRGLAVLAVRVNNVEVGFHGWLALRDAITDWRSSAEENYRYYHGRSITIVGDWFELEPGVPVDIEVVFGDFNGYDSQATLCVEEEGVEYDINRDGGPILPVFKTARIPPHLIDQLKYMTVDGDQDFESDLMFNVY